jgi:ribosomal protein S18 acetylase RimI-like enzyme
MCSLQLKVAMQMTFSAISIGVTIPAEAGQIMAIAREVDVFNAEEIVTVQELLDEYFARGAEASGYYFLSCRMGDQVIGFACYGPRALTKGAFDLFWIATAKSTGRQGIGGALLAQAAAEVKALGGRLIVAETSGRPDYAPTRLFYEKYGYVSEATIADFYAPGDDLMIYIYRLSKNSQGFARRGRDDAK